MARTKKPGITLADAPKKASKGKSPVNQAALFSGITPQDRNLTYVGISYTKQMINSLITEATNGETRRLSAFKRELLQDPFLFGEVNKVRSKLLKSPFRVITYPPSLTKPSVATTAEAKQASAISEFVRQQISDSEVLIKKTIEALWYGILDGVAVIEIVIEQVNGVIRLKALNPVPQERITCLPNSTKLAIQLTDDPSILTPLEDVQDRFIVLQETADPSPGRRGILRKCINPWFIKRYVSEFWVRHAELYGQPLRVAKYPNNDDELRAKLEQLLKNAGNAAYMAVPDSVMLEFINGATNANSALHGDLIQNMNESISICILGSTQTTAIAPDSGSRASSRIHYEVASTTVEGYALQICEVLRNQLMRRLVSYQFGDDAAFLYTPILQINISGYEDLKNFSVSVQTLANAGLRIPVSYVYDATGIPPADPDERCLIATPTTVNSPNGVAGPPTSVDVNNPVEATPN